MLKLFGSNKKKARAEFVEFHKQYDEEIFEISTAQGKNTAEVRRIIMSYLDGNNPETIKELTKTERDFIIKKLVNVAGISKSAIERATGISRGTIIRIINN